MKYRRQVQRDDRVPALGGKVLDRRDELDAGIVDQDIDVPERAWSSARPSRPCRRAWPDWPCRRQRGRRRPSPARRASLSISFSSPKPFSTTLAPALAKARAMPRPMPLVEPVTKAVLPASAPISISDLHHHGVHGLVSFSALRFRCFEAVKAEIPVVWSFDSGCYFGAEADARAEVRMPARSRAAPMPATQAPQPMRSKSWPSSAAPISPPKK